MTTRETVFTVTEHRDKGLTLDELQAAIEGHIGLTLTRENLRESDGFSSCDLVAASPTGVFLFKLELYRPEDRGWQVGGSRDFLSESYESLIGLHREAVLVEQVREGDDVIIIERRADGTVTETRR